MAQSIRYPEILKEELVNVHFSNVEVLNSSEERLARQMDLSLACRLGNEFKGKVSISFLTSEGPRQVITTVWNVGDDSVMLKGGAFIPIHAILGISREI